MAKSIFFFIPRPMVLFDYDLAIVPNVFMPDIVINDIDQRSYVVKYLDNSIKKKTVKFRRQIFYIGR